MSPSRWWLRVALLSLAFAAVTAVLGWWGVPLLALIWGIVGRGTRRPALTAGLAGAAGWAILLAWSATSGPVGVLAGKLGGIAGMPGGLFVGLTILLPFALAFVAARIPRQ